jgi:NADPH:quinone reductase-like Zn-dependent oxidoreductase
MDSKDTMEAYPLRMKAIRVHRFGGPEVLQLETDVPVPKLEPNQVLVRVMYAGVNPVETYIREGQYSRLPELPYIPGADASGVIAAVGVDCTKQDIKVGQRVFVTGRNSGAYAEYIVTDETFVFPASRGGPANVLSSKYGFSPPAAFSLVVRPRRRAGHAVLHCLSRLGAGRAHAPR